MKKGLKNVALASVREGNAQTVDASGGAATETFNAVRINVFEEDAKRLRIAKLMANVAQALENKLKSPRRENKLKSPSR